MKPAPVLDEGDTCPAEDCTGTLMVIPDGECTCAVGLCPPCLACENSTLVCVACGEAVGAPA